MKTASRIFFVVITSAALLPQHVIAATQAYWRHEEGTAGGFVAQGPDSVIDQIGVNHMRTFSPTTAGTYTTDVSPLDLRSGQPNTLAIDFGPGGDSPNRDDDNYTESKPINTQLFTAMTVELAFKMNAISGFQALFGKDGKPLGDAEGEDDSPVPPLKIMVRGDSFPGGIPNQLFVEWIDGDGTLNSDIHILAAGETVQPDTWYHVAFTLSAANAELWVAKETGPYVLADAASGDYVDEVSSSVQVFEPLGYTIGRGMFNNGVTDWADAVIDEVRVTDEVLTPDQFLFIPNETPVSDADFDNDGDVDGADLLTWQRALGSNVPNGTGADASGNGVVDAADLDLWKAQFGNGASPVAAVPEPATVGLASVSLAMAAACARRRR